MQAGHQPNLMPPFNIPKEGKKTWFLGCHVKHLMCFIRIGLTLDPQQPKRFLQNARCMKEEVQTQDSPDHHHLLPNEAACSYLLRTLGSDAITIFPS